MAFSFGNSGNAMLGNSAGAGGLNTGPDLETIQTEALGFLSIASDAKVRLTTPWTSQPSPTSSLLSIASHKGLVAAAGPDQVILASTESVRKGFEAPRNGDSDVRDFEPQLKMPMPMRVSQLCFTADENYLILSAESGGGLAVYEVQSLLQNSTNSTFELSTNSETLRAVIPNPTPEKAELCAIVTDKGNLHMANLKERRISDVLKDQVSCISWSAKGKQLCAGLADGTVVQMTPEGEAKAQIPKPPNAGDHHVSTLTWLENNLWLSIHTSNNESPPTSIYHIITRQPPSTFGFQKITDPVEPFGAEKAPHHSVLRLRDFPPALQDMLIISSTASTEVGVLSRSKKPLATDKPADSITNVFTTTEFLDDTKRPTLPMTDSMEDSTPIGIALDLSGKDKVYKPIPSDVELEESPGPLPGFWVLTHEGVLCSWWVVYNDSIKEGSTYPGLTTAAQGSGFASAPAPTPAAPSTSAFASPSTSAFGSNATPAPAFGSSSQLGQKPSLWGSGGPAKPAGATFGSSSFGTPSNASPAFGKPSAIGFGQSSQLGSKSSPWGAAAGGAASAAPSGQSGFSGFAKSNSGTFGGAAASSTPSSGGFAGFASQSGFASVANNTSGSSNSIFASPGKPSGAFGSGSSMDTAFPAKQDKPAGSVFGSTPFKLESTFKPDPSAKEDSAKPASQPGSSLFGSAFGSALTGSSSKPEAATPAAKDEDMDTTAGDETPQAKPKSSLFPPRESPESTTPTTTPAPPKFGLSTTPATTSSIFGGPSKFGAPSSNIFGTNSDTPKSGPGLFGSQQTTPKAATSLFGQPSKPNPFAPNSNNIFGQKSVSPQPVEEKSDDEESIGSEPEAPLPPDPVSRNAYPIGESSSSSAASSAPGQQFGTTTASSEPDVASEYPDAPLPPDFIESATKRSESSLSSSFVNVSKPAENAKAEDAPLPPDFVRPPKPKPALQEAPSPPESVNSEEDDDAPQSPSNGPGSVSIPGSDESDVEEEDDESEGSGIDVGKEDMSPTPGFTPQSSFGGAIGTTSGSVRQAQESRPLFGQLTQNAPVFPRPRATSPRSPSPVRGAIPNHMRRMEPTRSVSAPGMASQILAHRRSQFGPPGGNQEPTSPVSDPFMAQNRKIRARKEAEENQPLVDEDDDEIQRILLSEVEGSLVLDEFVAHSNVAPPAKESVPSQVEAVYRDVNSMIDTLGLNARSVKAFIKGHTENAQEGGRAKEDLEIPDDWVLCEIDELGEVLHAELHPDLEEGRVQDLDDKLDACAELTREMHRLRAKQEDLKKIIMVKMDPEQAEATRSLPLSAEQATQQNELRREFARFSKLLAEAEEGLTLLKTRIASVSSASGKGKANVPTVDAVIRTISKMTSMVEKRSGDVDVLENQLRKFHLNSRENSPMVTPQRGRRSVMFSPDSTPSRNMRHSLSGSVSLGIPARAPTPRKKLSGFNQDEKSVLMKKRTGRQKVLQMLKGNVEKNGVNVWSMEDIE